MLKCPHCTKDVGEYVPKDRFDEVNNALGPAKKKALALDALQEQWTEAQPKLARLGELEAQVATLTEERVTATFTSHGITNPKIRAFFQADFEEQAAAEDGEKDLAAYLTKIHTMPEAERPAHLAPFIKAPTPAVATPAPGTLPPRTVLPTRTVEPVTPPAPGPKLTGQQVAAQIAAITSAKPPANATPEQLAAWKTERRQKLDALEAQSKAPAAV